MPAHKRSAIVLVIFALGVIAGGIVRYYSGPGGDKGLYFGLVIGGVALLAALLAGLNRMLGARIAGGIAIGFVVLWFPFELAKEWSAGFSFDAAEIRRLVTIGLGLVTAIVLFRRAK